MTPLDLTRYFNLPRDPQLNFRIRILKPVWKDSNHRVQLTIESNGIPKDRRIVVEPALKQAPRENRGTCGARIVISWREGTSQHWTDSKSGEQIPRTGASVEEFGKLFVAGRHVESCPAPDSHLLITVRGVLPIVEIARSHRIMGPDSVLTIDCHEAIRVRKG